MRTFEWWADFERSMYVRDPLSAIQEDTLHLVTNCMTRSWSLLVMRPPKLWLPRPCIDWPRMVGIGFGVASVAFAHTID